MKSFLILALSMGLASNCIKVQPFCQLDVIKQKWVDWANASVEAEKIKFLEGYGLNLSHLDNPEVASSLRSSHDNMVQAEVNLYKEQILSDTVALDILVIQDIASKIFAESVEVLHESDFPKEAVCVLKNYETNNCYVILNSSEHAKKPELIDAILRHEYSHIVHEDNFYKELIQCVAWSNSNDELQEVAEKCNSFCRAFETRADVQAAINSIDHGWNLMEFLKASSSEALETYPKDSERIALLEKIKQELDSVIKK